VSAIVKVPKERLSPKTVRNIARKNWGLTWEQMKGMDVHYFPQDVKVEKTYQNTFMFVVENYISMGGTITLGL